MRMAEYTIPKPYRDFYVTNPYIELKESNERLEEETLVRSDIQYGTSLYGENTLENKEITVKVESKNLIPYPYANQTITQNGGTLTAGSDGGVTGSGTPTDTVSLVIGETIPITSKDIVTISQSGTFTNMRLQFLLYSQSTLLYSYELSDGQADSYLIDCSKYPTITNIQIMVKCANNDVEMSGTIYPQLERGDTATSYSKFVEDGTETTLTTCGKNLLDFPADGVIETLVAIENLSLKKGSVFTISCGAVTKGSENDPYIVFRKNSSIIKTIALISNLDFSFVLTDDITTVYLYSNGAQYAASQGVTSTVKNLMLEFGYFKTAYESYNETIQNITTGTEVTVSQLDKHTNMQSGSLNIALSTNFIKKIDYEINEKVTIITGLFDNRPTNTKTYPIIYIATDKTDTDRTTFLPAGKSGATASNWIYI